ncbi:MAG: VOC family protein [Pseudomonadota bacterium]
MSIATIFAHVSCGDIEVSARWYEKLFDRQPIRRSARGLVEWGFSESAEVQLCEEKEHAGHRRLTLGVLPLEPERERLVAAGLEPGPIEETEGYFVMRICDPDGNLIVFASARRVSQRTLVLGHFVSSRLFRVGCRESA